MSTPVISLRVGSVPPRTSTQGAGQAPRTENPATVDSITPAIDIHESQDGLVLVADLPGATENSLSVEVQDNVLTLSAVVELPSFPNARLIHEEFRPVAFHRSFILSDEVDRDHITAQFSHGVLSLFLPKAERARTRKIEVKTG
jgi:HSP20 family molecular chaperone IbpA